MNAATQTRPALRQTSGLARAYDWIKRSRAGAHACRTLAEVDSRTLRDIGFTRRDMAVLRVRGSVSSNSR